MPGDLGGTCGDYARVLFHFAREAAGAAAPPAFPAPSVSGQTHMHHSGTNVPRESRHVSRHCEERERRNNPFFLCAARWIASLALAMTVGASVARMDPTGRNEGKTTRIGLDALYEIG